MILVRGKNIQAKEVFITYDERNTRLELRMGDRVFFVH